MPLGDDQGAGCVLWKVMFVIGKQEEKKLLYFSHRFFRTLFQDPQKCVCVSLLQEERNCTQEQAQGGMCVY